MMQWAVDAGSPGHENTAWTRVQLGNLFFNMGDLESAEEQYKITLATRPGYLYALAGLGKISAARENYEESIRYFESASQAMPIPEFIISLAEVYAHSGDAGAAGEQIELLRAIQQLYESNGVDMDLEIALFNADHDIDLEQTLAMAGEAYARRPSVYAADVLAWALYKNGHYEEARSYARQALRLGTLNALFLFHAGVIEHQLGDTSLARDYLNQALEINPYFSLRYAPEARRILASLSTRE
jgi:tetratricopeptide (TPR) repeat protein